MACNGNCNNCWHKGLCDEQDARDDEKTDEFGFTHGQDDDDEYGGY